jgi:hypothetical protein
MWVPPGLIYLVVIATLLTRWFGSLEIPDGEPATTARGSS